MGDRNGKTATAEQANETIGFIRKTVGEMFCEKCAAKLRIQYGGSMNAGNCKELMAMPEIDGGLIGGRVFKSARFRGDRQLRQIIRIQMRGGTVEMIRHIPAPLLLKKGE